MTDFYLNWQEPETRRWIPVAKLVTARDHFIFGYTLGATVSAQFVPFGNLNDLNSIYVSTELFPIFANRVMNEKRPEFVRYSRWAALPVGQSNSLALMARMGGGRATDALQVYPVPERREDGSYNTVFFTHGISHLPSVAQETIGALKEEDRIYPMLDIQNLHDVSALALRSGDPATLLGYCPRYIAPDLAQLSKNPTDALIIKIKQVNYDAPPQFRLLCEATCKWPVGFTPCDSQDHKMISEIPIADVIGGLHVKRAAVQSVN